MSLEKLLFHKPILIVLERFLSLQDIVLLSSTCRLLKFKWFPSAPLRIGERIKTLFNWETLSIGPVKTYYKRLRERKLCVGGCGLKCPDTTVGVHRLICSSNMCWHCFLKKGQGIYDHLIKRGFVLMNSVITDHLDYARRCAQSLFGSRELCEFYFSESSDYAWFKVRSRCYTGFDRHYNFELNGREYIHLSKEEYWEIIERDVSDLKERIQTFMKKSFLESRDDVKNRRDELAHAVKNKKTRKRLYELVSKC